MSIILSHGVAAPAAAPTAAPAAAANCANCGSPATKRCGRCPITYCSRGCQVAHWKVEHKASCLLLPPTASDIPVCFNVDVDTSCIAMGGSSRSNGRDGIDAVRYYVHSYPDGFAAYHTKLARENGGPLDMDCALYIQYILNAARENDNGNCHSVTYAIGGTASWAAVTSACIKFRNVPPKKQHFRPGYIAPRDPMVATDMKNLGIYCCNQWVLGSEATGFHGLSPSGPVRQSLEKWHEGMVISMRAKVASDPRPAWRTRTASSRR
jgi:hypothetical protein